jgi:hypothetical protein
MIIILALLLASPAAAQDRCSDPRASIVEKLTGRYAERLFALWIDTTTGRIMEFYGSEERGTSTVISTDPNGTTCVESVGEMFQAIAPEPNGDKL